uniref:Putative secreted protein n=1 Tax=Anopheles marajoara TaxID=58244 RepID=A0A2M4C8J8_9DIPT
MFLHFARFPLFCLLIVYYTTQYAARCVWTNYRDEKMDGGPLKRTRCREKHNTRFHHNPSPHICSYSYPRICDTKGKKCKSTHRLNIEMKCRLIKSTAVSPSA